MAGNQSIRRVSKGLALKRVAARAGVGKATIYLRWASKEALGLDLLMQLAARHIAIDDTGNTRAELPAAVNTELGDPSRASLVQGRRNQVRDVIARGVARGDLQPNVSAVRFICRP